MDFTNSSPFLRSACFYVTITGNFERFQYFNFRTDFLKNESLFQKTGVQSFKYFDTKLPCQGPMLRQNGMEGTKWTYQKERSFVSDNFIFFKFWFSLRTIKS